MNAMSCRCRLDGMGELVQRCEWCRDEAVLIAILVAKGAWDDKTLRHAQAMAERIMRKQYRLDQLFAKARGAWKDLPPDPGAGGLA